MDCGLEATPCRRQHVRCAYCNPVAHLSELGASWNLKPNLHALAAPDAGQHDQLRRQKAPPNTLNARSTSSAVECSSSFLNYANQATNPTSPLPVKSLTHRAFAPASGVPAPCAHHATVPTPVARQSGWRGPVPPQPPPWRLFPRSDPPKQCLALIACSSMYSSRCRQP